MPNKVKITISGDGTGAITAIQGIGGATVAVGEKVGGVVSAMKAHWLALSATAKSAFIASDKAMEYINLDAKALQAEESFSLVAKSAEINAVRLLDAIKRGSAGIENVKLYDLAMANIEIRAATLDKLNRAAAESLQRHSAAIHDTKEEIGKLGVKQVCNHRSSSSISS